MEIIKNILDLNKAIKNFKGFGFVPTMGGIHEGHISLIKNSQKKCKKTIASIFVNPTQFNNKNDFSSYPRDLNSDINILKKFKVDYLFIPSVSEIYKKKIKSIKINRSDMILCAKYRKGHFEGVLNVMNRLLGIIKSKNVFMGEKDYQQIYLIKKYLSKKHNVNIVSCKIIRDKNSVSLSTRNKLLSKSSYLKVVKIVRFLKVLKKKLQSKKQFTKLNLKEIKYKIEKLYKIKIDYLEIRNNKNLKISNSNKKFRLFIAFKINNVRLIDNH